MGYVRRPQQAPLERGQARFSPKASSKYSPDQAAGNSSVADSLGESVPAKHKKPTRRDAKRGPFFAVLAVVASALLLAVILRKQLPSVEKPLPVKPPEVPGEQPSPTLEEPELEFAGAFELLEEAAAEATEDKQTDIPEVPEQVLTRTPEAPTEEPRQTEEEPQLAEEPRVEPLGPVDVADQETIGVPEAPEDKQEREPTPATEALQEEPAGPLDGVQEEQQNVLEHPKVEPLSPNVMRALESRT
ncbi:hypothetical protein ACSSS7_003993 [Eimeria intestinalis]